MGHQVNVEGSSAENQMWARSARSRPATSSPSDERASRARDSALEKRVGRGGGRQVGKEQFPGHLPADPEPGAHHDQLAEAFGRRAVPGAGAALAQLYGERAEEGHACARDRPTLRPHCCAWPRRHYPTPDCLRCRQGKRAECRLLPVGGVGNEEVSRIAAEPRGPALIAGVGGQRV